MKSELTKHSAALKTGPAQTYKHITMLPLLDGKDGGPPYLTLTERKINITETTQSGSVPELKVTNTDDQGEVWDHIQALHEKAHLMCPTHAMADVFKAREEDLHRCLESFPLLPGQNGLVVLITGQDCRLTGPSPVGTALVHDHKIIHAAVFRSEPTDQGSRIASLHRQRRFIVE